MNYNVLLGYVKQAWKKLSSWRKRFYTDVGLWRHWRSGDTDFNNLVVIWNTTSTYAIMTPFMKFTSTSKRMTQNIQKEPRYTALVKVLDRCANKITSFWIQENYRCMLTHATGVGTYASMEFRNLYITKTKWVNERWTISGTTAMKYGNQLTTSMKTTKNLPM